MSLSLYFRILQTLLVLSSCRFSEQAPKIAYINHATYHWIPPQLQSKEIKSDGIIPQELSHVSHPGSNHRPSGACACAASSRGNNCAMDKTYAKREREHHCIPGDARYAVSCHANAHCHARPTYQQVHANAIFAGMQLHHCDGTRPLLAASHTAPRFVPPRFHALHRAFTNRRVIMLEVETTELQAANPYSGVRWENTGDWEEC